MDLDETLVHFQESGENAAFNVRPYVRSFIEEVSQFYELILFTASIKEYADWILERIDPDNLIS